jgi:hypothetical protein
MVLVRQWLMPLVANSDGAKFAHRSRLIFAVTS